MFSAGRCQTTVAGGCASFLMVIVEVSHSRCGGEGLAGRDAMVVWAPPFERLYPLGCQLGRTSALMAAATCCRSTRFFFAFAAKVMARSATRSMSRMVPAVAS